MNLTEEDVINALESYRGKFDKTHEEMGVLCGMANGSTYHKWVNKITGKGRITYLLDFLNSTNQSFNDLFSNKAPASYQVPDDNLESVKAKIEFYSCPECRPRVKKIQDLENENLKLENQNKELDKKLREIQEKYIQCLEELKPKKENPLENSA